MNQTDIVKFVNEILGTEYTDFGQLRPLDIAKVDLAVQVDAHLRARVSPDQPDIAPRVVYEFSDLNDGALFSLPNFTPGFEPLYQKRQVVIVVRGQATTATDCPDCVFSQYNAQSLKGDMHQRHFCPDTPVLPVKSEPKDSRTLFYKLEPGESFLVPGGREGPHEKLASIHRTAANYCPDDNCPFEEEWLNARNMIGTFVHICPDTVVLPVPF